MSRTFRTAERGGYPALMIFGVVYLATLAIVFGSDSLRATPGTTAPDRPATQHQGKP